MDDSTEPQVGPKTVLGRVEASSAGFRSSRVGFDQAKQITSAAENSDAAFKNFRRARKSALKMRAAITESTEPGLLDSVRRALPSRQEIRARAVTPDPVKMAYERRLGASDLPVGDVLPKPVASISVPDNRPFWQRMIDKIKDMTNPSAVTEKERIQKDTANLLKQRLDQYGGNRQQQEPV